jgi:hypothetical protein
MPVEGESDVPASSADELAFITIVPSPSVPNVQASQGGHSVRTGGGGRSLGKTPSPSSAGRRRVENMPYVSPTEVRKSRTFTPASERGWQRSKRMSPVVAARLRGQNKERRESLNRLACRTQRASRHIMKPVV